ncbi:Bifunctional oligoribonuclease and PAP phosphatase NrnA [Candidatus Xiphinematobacter sp. Idaho Grape]|uniref:DHH family phosphoesterase n=1 Tax=Candidatus Xiphinematobacter sp. Idaho Grape TaxID=1704307 RepID=UPI000706136A|nr:bifunctional oligoribonuclease/PAP phosphatase NrnA [Candidatus Xiphinematobacter sp. Idaho Grape]ALJ56336.1 Bifunctional oligoribonuclease and PAP phosphatase NrnA [Candidatus Xiphinematobacter sp. Idaho Grape]
MSSALSNSPIPANVCFNQILSALHWARNILVTSHLRPDGDALGSAIASALWLRSLGKKVTTWNEDGVPSRFHYLPFHSYVSIPPTDKHSFDGVIVLDSPTRGRLGRVLTAIKSAGILINIDHHISNQRYGDLNYVDPSVPATGQILFDLFRYAEADFTPEISTNLYAAIATDTGSFQYTGTSQHTFESAAYLVRSGVQVTKLSLAMYHNQPRRCFRLLQHALNNTKFSCNGTIAHFSLSLSDLEHLQIFPEDNEGIIDHLRSVEDVMVALFFEELPGVRVRISARSKDARIDVCKICMRFGGGGHPFASGACTHGSLSSIREKFLTATYHEIQGLT